MGNITSILGLTSSLGSNRKGVSISAVNSNHLTNGKPDRITHIQEQDEGQEEIHVQVTVRSKKLRTEEDGTIILSPISECIVS